MKCSCQIRSRELWARQKGNLWYPEMREEQRKEWIPCVPSIVLCHHFFCGITCFTSLVLDHSIGESLEWALRDRQRWLCWGERREHRQLSVWCSYLVSAYICEAHSILLLLQEPFFVGSGPADRECPSSVFTKSERWYLCTGLGNDKVDVPVGKAHLCLDYLSQLKEGKAAFNSPKPGLQHGLNSIIVQESAQACTWYKTHAWFTLPAFKGQNNTGYLDTDLAKNGTSSFSQAHKDFYESQP